MLSWHTRTHRHTDTHTHLYTYSFWVRQYIENHCHNHHLAMNWCQDPSNTYLVTVCWIVIRSDGTNKDNYWLRIEFWLYLQLFISSPILITSHFAFCSFHSNFTKITLDHISGLGRSPAVVSSGWNDHEGVFLHPSSPTRFLILVWLAWDRRGWGEESKRKGRRHCFPSVDTRTFSVPSFSIWWPIHDLAEK